MSDDIGEMEIKVKVNIDKFTYNYLTEMAHLNGLNGAEDTLKQELDEWLTNFEIWMQRFYVVENPQAKKEQKEMNDTPQSIYQNLFTNFALPEIRKHRDKGSTKP